MVVTGIKCQGLSFGDKNEISRCNERNAPYLAETPPLFIEYIANVYEAQYYDIPVFNGIDRDVELFSIPVASSNASALSLANACFIIE